MKKQPDKGKITALYERLSHDDERAGESVSIENQKRILEDYALKNGFTNIRHFTDDGVRGTTFKRPGLDAMLEEIRAGNVATVIIKDQSRIGRDVVEVGLLKRTFDEYHVRFIAANDNLDTANGFDIMINSALIPEENLTEFYDGFDMLEALLNDIYGKGETMEMNGDQTLGKELTFSVFCRRWGHADSYRMQRTIDGWNVRHISINGACDPDGTGALLMNLQHDSIFYPEEGVKYGLQKLWEDADDGKIDVEQLQIKLQQIADWISKVEQVVGAGQPEWLNYY